MQAVMENQLISHCVSPENIENVIQKIATRIKATGDKPYASVEYQLELLTQLSQFEFGRFLIANQGINGFWTHYMLTHPWFKQGEKNAHGEVMCDMERFILESAPLLLATQQRFEIFLQENQKQVKNGAKLACIPCGMMGELLYLNFDKIENIELIGIDYDADTFKDAQMLAKKQGLLHFSKFIQCDAWQLNVENEFDLISSNGLNIYQSDFNKVKTLYQQFCKALKPGGKLVTSHFTLPPTMGDQCEWDMAKIDQKNLLLQKIIFVDVIAAKWQSYQTTVQMKEMLSSVGFHKIEFIFDQAKVFPTVVAYKR